MCRNLPKSVVWLPAFKGRRRCRQVPQCDGYQDADDIGRLKPHHAPCHEAVELRHVVVCGVKRVGDDEPGNDEEHLDSEPSIGTRIAHGVPGVCVGHMKPGDAEGGKTAQRLDLKKTAPLNEGLSHSGDCLKLEEARTADRAALRPPVVYSRP